MKIDALRSTVNHCGDLLVNARDNKCDTLTITPSDLDILLEAAMVLIVIKEMTDEGAMFRINLL